jgi:hypothetical protein
VRAPSLLTSDRKRVLVLTATVHPDPHAANRLAVLDPELRRRQYEASLRFHAQQLSGLVDGIVLAENSGADLSGFADPGSPVPVELLSLPGASTSAGTRRGYLELSLLSQAFDASMLLAHPDAVAIKVTGRYRVENLPAVIGSMDPRHDLGFNLRQFPHSWADMAVCFLTPAGMTALRPHLPKVNQVEPGGSAELSLYRVLSDLRTDGVAVQPRFGVEPRITGMRGYDARPYQGVQQRLKWLARSAAKRLLPYVWV